MSDDVCIFNRLPDVEAIFRFSGTRSRPYADGYRPAHRVTDNYLTTGVHHYNYTKFVPSDGTATGTITFLTQEGDHIVGYATITKVLNPLLLCNNIDQKN